MKPTLEELPQLENLPTLYFIIVRPKQEGTALSVNSTPPQSWKLAVTSWAYTSFTQANYNRELRKKQNHRLDYSIIAYSPDLTTTCLDYNIKLPRVVEEIKPTPKKRAKKVLVNC